MHDNAKPTKRKITRCTKPVYILQRSYPNIVDIHQEQN